MSQLRGNLDDRRENVGSSVYTHFSIAPQKPIWPLPSKLFPPETFRRIDQISPPDHLWFCTKGGEDSFSILCINPLCCWKKSIIGKKHVPSPKYWSKIPILVPEFFYPQWHPHNIRCHHCHHDQGLCTNTQWCLFHPISLEHSLRIRALSSITSSRVIIIVIYNAWVSHTWLCALNYIVFYHFSNTRIWIMSMGYTQTPSSIVKIRFREYNITWGGK